MIKMINNNKKVNKKYQNIQNISTFGLRKLNLYIHISYICYITIYTHIHISFMNYTIWGGKCVVLLCPSLTMYMEASGNSSSLCQVLKSSRSDLYDRELVTMLMGDWRTPSLQAPPQCAGPVFSEYEIWK